MYGLIYYDEFINTVVENIKDYLPEEYKDAEITLVTTTKTNSFKLTGIIIKKNGNNIAPTIYLEDYYELYISGTEITAVIEKIADARVRNEVQRFDTSQITNFENAKEKIVPYLINTELSKEYIEGKPHKDIEDLTVAYKIILEDDICIGKATVTITNEILNKWEITEEELHDIAISNMPKLIPTTFKGMNEAIQEVILDTEDAGSPEDECFYVLCNTEKTYGATAILDKTMMNKILEEIGEFYILPCSIHELIILPKIKCPLTTQALKGMVKEMNQTEIKPDEVLSNSIYEYTAEKGFRRYE